MPEAQLQKRKRIYGTFSCEFPGCSRVFNRADHLSRHKRNHEPQKNYVCPWPMCSMSFARNDVKEKHYRRHLNKRNKHTEKTGEQVQFIDSRPAEGMQSNQSTSHDPGLPPAKRYAHEEIDSLNSAAALDPKDLQEKQISAKRYDHEESSSLNSAADFDPKDLHEEQISATAALNSGGNDIVHSKNYIPFLSNTLSPSDLIEWLFHEDANLSNDSSYFDPAAESASSADDFSDADILKVFSHNNTSLLAQHLKVSVETRSTLAKLIPPLELNPDFTLEKLERCLEIYWLLYHPQYPILHRPSFSTKGSNPLLLLSMIMAGAGLAHCTGAAEPFESPLKLADEIANPLRWMIFAHSECKPPARVWVIQSLLILESYEITSTTRFLHERAYLHHGMKVQLLRRSPILGGDPSKDEQTYDDGKQWVQAESMKRATLMAFYLDTVHATVYGHMVILYAHQIKMALPCNDELWENDGVPDTGSAYTQPPKFLSTLRKLLHREPVSTSAFGKKILLAGLLTIVFQMQQKDLQLSFLEWNSMKESWKQTISLAVDVWRVDICGGIGCCDTSNSLYLLQGELQNLPPMLRLDDKRCKFGLYHIAQIYMRISHYDYIVYAGAPSRMNVKTGSTEYNIVEYRVKEWAGNINGGISVVHAYLFLCEMLLSPDNSDISYSYDPNNDPLLHRRNIMASAMLVIFCYNYALEGPESNVYDQLSNEYFPDIEDGHSYLKRIKKEMSKGPGGPLQMSHTSSSQFHECIKLHASYLVDVKDKNHIVGLLKLFYKAYRTSNWEIGKEYSNLFKNCIERCLGRKKITCDDMYASQVV